MPSTSFLLAVFLLGLCNLVKTEGRRSFTEHYGNLCENNEKSFYKAQENEEDEKCLKDWEYPSSVYLIWLLGIENENITNSVSHYNELSRISKEDCPSWSAGRKCALRFVKRNYLKCSLKEPEEEYYQRELLSFFLGFALNDAFCVGMRRNYLQKFFENGGSDCMRGITRQTSQTSKNETPLPIDVLHKFSLCLRPFNLQSPQQVRRWFRINGRKCVIQALEHCNKETLVELNPLMDLVEIAFHSLSNQL